MIPMIHPTRNINGTSLQGYVEIKVSELIATFGEPHMTYGDKTTMEWAFKTSDGVVFTIYDYKEDVTPKGVYAWHIGGCDRKAVTAVAHIFVNHLVASYR